jgi:hypothetical protein
MMTREIKKNAKLLKMPGKKIGTKALKISVGMM